MSRVFSVVKEVITKKADYTRRRRSVGLSWFVEKRLKHDSSSSVKQFKLFDKPLSYVSAQDLLHGLEEIFIDECYKIDLPEKSYILDCGGNIGLSVLYFSKSFPNAEIVTFEPDKVNYQLLKSNIEAFGLSNVTLRQEAIWNQETVLNFSGNASLGSSIAKNDESGTYTVPATQLGPFINRKVDLLKLDIEGAEYEVVKDIEPLLDRVQNMFLEYHSTFQDGYKLTELLEIVRKAGFFFYLREVFEVHPTPFFRQPEEKNYDIQLNIYCFRK